MIATLKAIVFFAICLASLGCLIAAFEIRDFDRAEKFIVGFGLLFVAAFIFGMGTNAL